MKSIFSKTTALVAVSAILFSFSPTPGGEGFEIYLNNKVVIQQFGSDIKNQKSLELNPSSPNDKLTVKYHHCGRVGKNRVVTIKDAQNNVLKEFRYADAATPVSAMSVPVKDILALKKASSNTLRLYYTSSELPKGRMLVNITTAATNMSKL